MAKRKMIALEGSWIVGVLRRSGWVWVVGLVVVSVGYLLSFELQWQPFFLMDDNASYFFPSYLHNVRMVFEERTIPFINYYQYLGNRHLGQGQVAVFYWPVYLAFGLVRSLGISDWWVIDVLVVGHLALGVVGMWQWMRVLGVRKGLAVGWSLVWLTFPFVVGVPRNWVIYAYLLGWLPWNFFLLERLRKQSDKKGVVWLGIVKFHLLLAGYVQWVVTVGMFEGLWWLVRGGGSWKNRLRRGLTARWFWASHVFVLLLGAFVWLPVAYSMVISASRKGALDIREFAYPYVDGGQFLWAQVGRFQPEAVFNAESHLFFIGLGLLGMVFGLLVPSRRNRLWTQAKEYGVLSLVAFGLSTALMAVLFWVPVINWFRYPVKHFGVYLCFLAVSLGLFSEREWKKERRRWGWGLGIGFMLVMNILVSQSKTEPGSLFLDGSASTSESWKEGYLEIISASKGRVVTVGRLGLKGRDENEFLSKNYATIYKKHQFSGYDPILPRSHFEEIIGTDSLASIRKEVTEEELAQLRKWGVRYWVVANKDPEVRGWITGVEENLNKVMETEKAVLYEDVAAEPMVELERGRVHEWGNRGNSLFSRVEVYAEMSEVRFNFLYHPWYYAWVDGRWMGPVIEAGKKLGVEVNQGSHEVRVAYVDWAFWVGIGVAGFAGLGLGLWRKRLFDWISSEK